MGSPTFNGEGRGILVKRSVRVKVIVTEQFRARRLEELRAGLANLDTAKQRIEFELRSAEKRSGSQPQSAAALVERLRTGLRNNERAAGALSDELERVSAAEIGSEYDRGTIEGMIEVNVGDDLSRITSCEIVVEDGRIVEIRDGLCP